MDSFLTKYKLTIGVRNAYHETHDTIWITQGCPAETDDAGILYFRQQDGRRMAISPHYWCYFHSEPIKED